MARALVVPGRLAAGLLVAAVATGSAAALWSQQQQPAPAARPARPARLARPDTQLANQKVVVYKSPSCGCCTEWVNYMRTNGFTVEVHDQENVAPIKRASGVPPSMESCHTSQVGGYVVEGHVPVEDIRRMLRERPAILGLAAPGMPAGAPGMGTGGGYNVLTFARDGRSQVYQRH